MTLLLKVLSCPGKYFRMKIAAQLLSTTEIKFFIEESGWSKTTVPFNREQVKVELAAFFIDGIAAFHDASPKPEPWTNHPSLMFCREKLTVAKFKRELKVTGETEPYEVLLTNDSFTLRKEFADAYSITFPHIYDNRVFTPWLKKFLPKSEFGIIMQQLNETGRYHSQNLPEFMKYPNIDKFIARKLELWWIELVKSYDGIEKGDSAKHDVTDNRYKPISFY